MDYGYQAKDLYTRTVYGTGNHYQLAIERKREGFIKVKYLINLSKEPYSSTIQYFIRKKISKKA